MAKLSRSVRTDTQRRNDGFSEGVSEKHRPKCRVNDALSKDSSI